VNFILPGVEYKCHSLLYIVGSDSFCVDESQMVSTTRVAVGQKSMPLIFVIISVNAFESLHSSESKAFNATPAKPLLKETLWRMQATGLARTSCGLHNHNYTYQCFRDAGEPCLREANAFDNGAKAT
jgi:hypothetical protein